MSVIGVGVSGMRNRKKLSTGAHLPASKDRPICVKPPAVWVTSSWVPGGVLHHLIPGGPGNIEDQV